jgi:LPPG:FO 2-phospho-L-lactate transferase
MCDEPVRTRVKARGAWHPFQEFMIKQRAAGPVEDVAFEGIEAARATPEVLEALERADLVVIGPSNPVISIGPILAVPGVREAMTAPVIAVSPLVRGQVLKGPTDQFLAWAGHPLSSNGIAAHYEGLLEGLVADEAADNVPTLVTDVEMSDHAAARRLAREVLALAERLEELADVPDQ